MEFPNELVGAWFQGGHFQLQGFATRHDLLNPQRRDFKFFIFLVLIGDDKDKGRVGLDAEFFWTKAMLVKRECEFWRGIGGKRERRTASDGYEDNLKQPDHTSHEASPLKHGLVKTSRVLRYRELYMILKI